MNERRMHQLFVIGVMLKGVHALIECAGGAAFAFVNIDSIKRLLAHLNREDLIGLRNDFVATHLAKIAEGFTPGAKHFYAFYLLSHGVVKLALIAGLLKGKLWAYPASLVVLGLFILYQVYRYALTHSAGLIVLTVFDLIVIGLIWHEYRTVARHGLKNKA